MPLFTFRVGSIILAFILKVLNYVFLQESQSTGYVISALSLILLLLAFIPWQDKAEEAYERA